MQPDEKEQLLQAKALIQQKRYDEARNILEGLPFNETAFQWLTKLNQIAPAQPINSFSNAGPSFPSNAAPTAAKTSTTELPALPPKRASAYQPPKSKGFLNYLGQGLVGIFFLVIYVVLRFGGFSLFDDLSSSLFGGGTFDSPYFIIEYSGDWEEYSNTWATYCQEPDENCFLTLIREDSIPVHASAMIFDFDVISDTQSYLNGLAGNYDDGDPQWKFVRQSTVSISGVQATVIHDIFYHPEDPAYYNMRVYIPVKGGIIQVNCWSQDEGVQADRVDDYLEVLGTIEWKDGVLPS